MRNDAAFTAPTITFASQPTADCSGGPPAAIGTLCTNDGTVYAGISGGKYIYTTPSDESGTYTWNNGSTNYQTRLAGFAPMPNNPSDGEINSNIINSWVNGVYATVTIADAPYYAANACKLISDANYLGHNDWYLPCSAELGLLYTNREAIGGFASTHYWSSQEYPSSVSNAYYRNFADGNATANYKYTSYRVRCIRN